MKKYLTLSLVSFIVSTNCFSQNILSVSPGVSLPGGNFGSTNQSNQTAGYAAAGENLQILFEHKLNKTFALAAMLYGERNSLNTTSLANQLNQTKFYLPYFSSTSQQTSDPQYAYFPGWSIDKKAWWLESALLGGTVQVPFTHIPKLSFAAKAMIGAAHVSMPALSAQSITDTTAAYITQNSSSSFGFSYIVGTGVSYKLQKKLSLCFDINYFGAAGIKFKNVTETMVTLHGFNIPNMPIPSNAQAISTSSFTTTEKQPVSSLNINVGISVQL